ncbi:MAG TPA: hypothetical protein VF723_06115 [Pyrinomonadaceae bacterium]
MDNDNENAANPFIRIAGICAMLAPLVLIIGDAMLLTGELRFEWTIALWVSFVLFAPAIIGLTYLAAANGSRLALLGGASAFVGCLAGASMQVFFRVWAVLYEAGSPQTIELLRSSKKLVASTQMIGIFFPLGLLILAACLYRRHLLSPIAPLSLAGAAILFPLGRIAGLLVGVVGGDLLLLVSFFLIGRRLLSAQSLSRV